MYVVLASPAGVLFSRVESARTRAEADRMVRDAVYGMGYAVAFAVPLDSIEGLDRCDDCRGSGETASRDDHGDTAPCFSCNGIGVR